MASKSRRGLDYIESLQRLVNLLELEPYRCASGYNLAEMSGLSVVFDLSHLSDDIRMFFEADLMTRQDAWREYEKHRSLELVIVLDEPSKFYSKRTGFRDDLSEPFILQMLRMSRKKGIGLVLADQTYSVFDEIARSNAQNKVVFQTPDGPSRHLAAAR